MGSRCGSSGGPLSPVMKKLSFPTHDGLGGLCCVVLECLTSQQGCTSWLGTRLG